MLLLKFNDQPNLVVAADKGTKDGVKRLDKLRAAIVACQGTRKVLEASKYNENHSGFASEEFSQLKGVKVNLGELSIRE